MRMILALLALCCALSPAAAEDYTVFRYDAYGSGIHGVYDYDLDDYVIQRVRIHAWLIVPQWGCSRDVTCGIAGQSIHAMIAAGGGSDLLDLDFDHVLGGWPSSPAGFVGGYALGGDGDSFTEGTLRSLRVSTFGTDDDDYRPEVRVQSLGPVPEPASWAMMIAGLGFVGNALRRRAPALRAA